MKRTRPSTPPPAEDDWDSDEAIQAIYGSNRKPKIFKGYVRRRNFDSSSDEDDNASATSEKEQRPEPEVEAEAATAAEGSDPDHAPKTANTQDELDELEPVVPALPADQPSKASSKGGQFRRLSPTPTPEPEPELPAYTYDPYRPREDWSKYETVDLSSAGPTPTVTPRAARTLPPRRLEEVEVNDVDFDDIDFEAMMDEIEAEKKPAEVERANARWKGKGRAISSSPSRAPRTDLQWSDRQNGPAVKQTLSKHHIAFETQPLTHDQKRQILTFALESRLCLQHILAYSSSDDHSKEHISRTVKLCKSELEHIPPRRLAQMDAGLVSAEVLAKDILPLAPVQSLDPEDGNEVNSESNKSSGEDGSEVEIKQEHVDTRAKTMRDDQWAAIRARERSEVVEYILQSRLRVFAILERIPSRMSMELAMEKIVLVKDEHAAATMVDLVRFDRGEMTVEVFVHEYLGREKIARERVRT